MDLSMTAVELGKKIRNKEISVVEATTEHPLMEVQKQKKIKMVMRLSTSVFQVPDMNGQREHWQWQRKKDIWMNI